MTSDEQDNIDRTLESRESAEVVKSDLAYVTERLWDRVALERLLDRAQLTELLARKRLNRKDQIHSAVTCCTVIMRNV